MIKMLDLLRAVERYFAGQVRRKYTYGIKHLVRYQKLVALSDKVVTTSGHGWTRGKRFERARGEGEVVPGKNQVRTNMIANGVPTSVARGSVATS